MESWREELTLTPEYIKRNQVFAAAVDGEIVAFYALILQGALAVLDHLWVKPDRLRSGIGRALWQHALERAQAHGATRVELEAEPNAVGFYATMGACRIGERPVDFGRILPTMRIDLNPVLKH